MSANLKHLPVLVDEVVSYLKPESKKIYFDGTFGQGGYSKQILKFSRILQYSCSKFSTRLQKKSSQKLLVGARNS